ncbi:hypothetical protein GYMLUDRAFT_45381 [Collybiopsis luxurians FD-317 M1]|uniref:Uncharacterized protein n=1 Tax=Collybiopsis luxurians FD-317 M1 TaxID=944289 RepID=A0A0D0B4F8_9AGAR|nr:hypothetical protein GYMLUDRAFT_45381 [Collybiopsis luxurians FD-317 M1]
MPEAYVCGVYDSVLHPMLLGLDLCALDKTRKSTVRKRLAEIDAAIRNRKTKLRPCFVIPEHDASIGGGRSWARVCLMATFDGSGIDDLPKMFRYFVTPVKSGSKDGYPKTFKEEDCITTTPIWKPKEGVETQWVICFLYRVKVADLRPWRGKFVLDTVEQDRLVELCYVKSEKWFRKVRGAAAAPVQMLKSILVRNLPRLGMKSNLMTDANRNSQQATSFMYSLLQGLPSRTRASPARHLHPRRRIEREQASYAVRLCDNPTRTSIPPPPSKRTFRPSIYYLRRWLRQKRSHLRVLESPRES